MGHMAEPTARVANEEVAGVRDKRSGQVLFLAHCLPNQNAKVLGLAGYRGTFEPLIRLLVRSGAGLVQMPCPEAVCLGLGRPLGTDTVEQYDTPRYQSVCRKLAKAAAREMKSYQAAGYKLLGVLGVEGSPSCSVAKTPRLVKGKRRLVRRCGLFMEALRSESARERLKVAFVGIPECPEAGDLKKAMAEIVRITKKN